LQVGVAGCNPKKEERFRREVTGGNLKKGAGLQWGLQAGK